MYIRIFIGIVAVIFQRFRTAHIDFRFRNILISNFTYILIKDISACFSNSLFFWLFLLLFLLMSSFYLLLLFAEICQSLSLLFNVLRVLPVIPITWNLTATFLLIILTIVLLFILFLLFLIFFFFFFYFLFVIVVCVFLKMRLNNFLLFFFS